MTVFKVSHSFLNFWKCFDITTFILWTLYAEAIPRSSFLYLNCVLPCLMVSLSDSSVFCSWCSIETNYNIVLWRITQPWNQSLTTYYVSCLCDIDWVLHYFLRINKRKIGILICHPAIMEHSSNSVYYFLFLEADKKFWSCFITFGLRKKHETETLKVM